MYRLHFSNQGVFRPAGRDVSGSGVVVPLLLLVLLSRVPESGIWGDITLGLYIYPNCVEIMAVKLLTSLLTLFLLVKATISIHLAMKDTIY
jgi:hypothetical protein